MSVNTINQTDSNIENNNNSVNNSLDYGLAQNDYIESKIKSDINYFHDFDSKINEDFTNFIDSKSKYEKLSIEFSKESKETKNNIISKLKNKIVTKLAPISNTKDRIINKFLFEYKDENNFSNNLKKSLEKVNSETKLANLLKYSANRTKFLVESKIFKDLDEAIFKKNEVDKEDKIKNNLKIDITKLSDTEKNELYILFNSYSKIDISDLDMILNKLSDSEKISLIKYFVESISYSDLEKLNLVTPEIKSKIKSDFKIKSKKYFILDDNKLDEIFNDLLETNKDNFFIDLSSLSLEKNVSDLIKGNSNIKNQLVDFYNKEVEINSDIDSKILHNLESVGENEDIHNSFIDNIKNNQKINQIIRGSIDNFKDGNFIVIDNVDSNGNKTKEYFYIKSVGNGIVKESKNVVIRNVTNPEGGYDSNLQGKNERLTYSKVFKLIENISLNSENGYKLEFIDKNDLKNKEIVEDDNINTLDELKNKLDLIDLDGINIPFSSDKVVFEQTKGDDNFVFGLEGITSTGVKINQGAEGIDEYTFNDFYKGFVDFGLKRKEKIDNFNDFENKLSSSGNEAFSPVYLGGENKDKLVLKSDKDNNVENKSDYYGVRYFVGGDGKAIYINSIGENEITYTFGKYTDKTKDKKFKFEKISDSYTSTSFNQLISDIDKYKLEAKTDDIKGDYETQEEIDGEKNLKGSFLSKYLSRLSISEVLGALKFLPDTLEKSLERGSKLKSLKLAESIASVAGKDSSFYLNMKSSVEQEEKSLTEEITNNLKSLGSKDMLIQVKKILLNKNTEEYELVAAMMAVVSKYGVLYPKSLREFEGSNIWFKRLGGTPEAKKKFEESLKPRAVEGKPEPLYFTEERLVENWLGQRSKAGTIRSKLDKDFGNALSGGIKEEMEDGEMKSGNKFTTDGRIGYFLGELGALGFPNAVGSLENIFAKNGSSKQMQAIPFVLAISGYGKKFDQVLLNKIIGLSFSTPYTSLFFNKDADSLELYKNYISELIDDKYKGDSGMRNKFDGLFKISNPEKKVNAIYEFWTDYGDKLVDDITLKDPYTILKSETNNTYKKYYETLKGVHSSGEFGVKQDDVKYGVYDKNPIAYTGGGLELIKSDASGGFSSDEGKLIFNSYIDGIKKMLDYDFISAGISEKDYKKHLQDVIWKISYRIFEKSGSYTFSETSPFINLITKKLGIKIYNDTEYSSKEDYLDKVYKQLMSNKSNSNNNTNNTGATQNFVKTEISSLINDENYNPQKKAS